MATQQEFPLPPVALRDCGEYCRDDLDWINTGNRDFETVASWGITQETSILEVGCGAGRFARALRAHHGDDVQYHGIDVFDEAIKWCREHFPPAYKFSRVDMHNDRFNPTGKPPDQDAYSQLQDHSFDVAYAYAVFLHMIQDDIKWYLDLFRRVVKPEGWAFVTAHVECDVPARSINPDRYPEHWQRSKRDALHAVRYNWDYFTTLLANHGWRIAGVTRESWRKQTGLFLRKIA